jgi:hypothetical protein
VYKVTFPLVKCFVQIETLCSVTSTPQINWECSDLILGWQRYALILSGKITEGTGNSGKKTIRNLKSRTWRVQKRDCAYSKTTTCEFS